MPPGTIVATTDHINLMGDNPLIGPNDDTLGPRFPDMSEPYSRALVRLAERVALEQQWMLQRAVFVGVAGPNLETAAEYRFLRRIGADIVGMSLVPESIVARARRTAGARAQRRHRRLFTRQPSPSGHSRDSAGGRCEPRPTHPRHHRGCPPARRGGLTDVGSFDLRRKNMAAPRKTRATKPKSSSSASRSARPRRRARRHRRASRRGRVEAARSGNGREASGGGGGEGDGDGVKPTGKVVPRAIVRRRPAAETGGAIQVRIQVGIKSKSGRRGGPAVPEQVRPLGVLPPQSVARTLARPAVRVIDADAAPVSIASRPTASSEEFSE